MSQDVLILAENICLCRFFRFSRKGAENVLQAGRRCYEDVMKCHVNLKEIRFAVLLCVHRSASRVKHAAASVSASRSARSHRVSGRVQPAADGGPLVEGGPDTRLRGRSTRPRQQIRHADPAACDSVRRGTVLVSAVLAARCRTRVHSRPRLRPRSVYPP